MTVSRRFTIADIATAVSADDQPRPEPQYDPYRLNVAGALGIEADAVSAYYVGSGRRVLEHFLSAESLRWFAPVAPNLREVVERARHYREFARIVTAFLSPAAELPASLCSHCLCITDRCVSLSEGASRHIGGIDYFQKYDYKLRARLRFDNVGVRSIRQPPYSAPGGGFEASEGDFLAVNLAGRSPGGSTSLARDANFIDIRTGELDWVYPPGMTDTNPAYVKYVEESSVLRGQDVQAAVHRERFGPARKKEHEASLNRGIYPAIEGRTHALLWGDGPRGGPLAAEGRLGRRGGWTRDEVIDPSGVWDVQVLKAERLFERGGGRTAPDLFCDTLAIYLDRLTNKVFCINAIREKVGYMPLDQLPRTIIGRWFLQRQRPGDGDER